MARRKKILELVPLLEAVMVAFPHPTLTSKYAGTFVFVDKLPDEMSFEVRVSSDAVELLASWQLDSPASQLLRRHVQKQNDKDRIDRFKVDSVQYKPDKKTVHVQRTLPVKRNADLLEVSCLVTSFIESAIIIRGVLDWS